MKFDHIGRTKDGGLLVGGENEHGVKEYYLATLVAVEVDEQWFCLPGVWEPDAQTTIVGEAELERIANQE